MSSVRVHTVDAPWYSVDVFSPNNENSVTKTLWSSFVRLRYWKRLVRIELTAHRYTHEGAPMSVEKSSFGKLADGREAFCFALRSDTAEVRITNVRSLLAHARSQS